MNILKVQQELNRQLETIIPFTPLVEDGIYGIETKRAIALFQAKNSITVDGIAGPATLKLLFPEDHSLDVVSVRQVPPLKPGERSLVYRAMQYMLAQVGVKEATGNNDGPAVEAFLRAVGLGRGFYWCMAFVYWAFSNAFYDLFKNNNTIILPLLKTGGCMMQYNFCKINAGKPGYETMIVLNPKEHDPKPGDIFIIDLGKGAGHTGVITNINLDGSLATVEGNTNDNGSANGDGVYERVRHVEKLFALIRIAM